jgi:hypothetical protein
MRPTKLGVGVGAAIAAVTIAAVPIASGISAGAESADRAQLERPAAALFRTHPLDSENFSAAKRQFQTGVWYGAVLEGMAAERAARSSGRGRGCAAGDWECFKACTIDHESGGAYGAQSSNGTYRGAYQFDQRTWDSNAAASGRPDLVGQDPAGASAGDQDQIAHDTYQRRGKAPWGGRC